MYLNSEGEKLASAVEPNEEIHLLGMEERNQILLRDQSSLAIRNGGWEKISRREETG